MANSQMERDKYPHTPKSILGKHLLQLHYKFGEFEEELQCSLPVDQRNCCEARVKGILRDNSTEPMRNSEKLSLQYYREHILKPSADVSLASCSGLKNQNCSRKTRQIVTTRFPLTTELQDILLLVGLICEQIHRLCLCICLRRFVSPSLCPYAKTCKLNLKRKEERCKGACTFIAERLNTVINSGLEPLCKWTEEFGKIFAKAFEVEKKIRGKNANR